MRYMKPAVMAGLFERAAAVRSLMGTPERTRSCIMPILGELPPYLPLSPANEHASRMRWVSYLLPI